MPDLFCIALKQYSSPVWVTHIRTYRCISQMDLLLNLKWMQKCHKLLVLQCNISAIPTSLAFLGFWIPSCFRWFTTTSVNTLLLWSSFPSWKVIWVTLKNTFNILYFSNYLFCIFVRKCSIPYAVSHSRIGQRKFHLEEALYLKFWNAQQLFSAGVPKQNAGLFFVPLPDTYFMLITQLPTFCSPQ